MNANFSLSKSNKILLVIFLIFPLLKLIFSQKSVDAKLGAFTGEIFLFLFATACAWIVWRIFKRNHKAGSIMFNILMSMLLVAKLADIGHTINESHELKNLENEQQIIKNNLANT